MEKEEILTKHQFTFLTFFSFFVTINNLLLMLLLYLNSSDDIPDLGQLFNQSFYRNPNARRNYLINILYKKFSFFRFHSSIC